MKILIFCAFLVTLIFTSPVVTIARDYILVKEESSITFSGIHAGNEFTGNFDEFDAKIHWDETQPDGLKATIAIKTASVQTGNKMYDSTLLTGDWFNISKYPEIQYTIHTSEAKDLGTRVFGDLQIKNITKPFDIFFKLTGETKKIATAEFTINRLNYGLGIKSDPDAEWVDDEIKVKVKLVAK
jgi:polyisoprenoid-binding protein YceI